jgi:hypothetical protein
MVTLVLQDQTNWSSSNARPLYLEDVLCESQLLYGMVPWLGYNYLLPSTLSVILSFSAI